MYTLELLESEISSRIINPDFKDLIDVLNWFGNIEIENIQTHFGFEDETYCRVPLIAKEQYDLLLCCWKPGQESPFHGHPNQGCLVKILTGTLSEEVRYSDGSVEIRENNPNNVAYLTDKIGIHQVRNISDENAVSLHLYAPGGYRPVYL